MKHLIALSLLAASGGTFAQSYTSVDGVQWAAVRSVEPLTHAYAVPGQVCSQGTTQRVVQQRGNTSNAFIGTAVGGVIGSRFGQGNGRLAATATGAGIGAMAGYELGPVPGYVEEVPVTTCRQQTTYQQRSDGYRVSYEFGGQMYTSVMAQPPGKRIRVNVSVTPADSVQDYVEPMYQTPRHAPPAAYAPAPYGRFMN